MNKLQKFIARLLIPKGYYCEGCPFHFIDSGRLYQENGYCSYLKKGDWDINAEYPDQLEVTQRKDGKTEKIMIDKEEVMPLSLLWDGCKECDINV
jgi:hypothetical protein